MWLQCPNEKHELEVTSQFSSTEQMGNLKEFSRINHAAGMWSAETSTQPSKMRFTQPVSTLRRVPRQVAGEGSSRVCGAQAVTAAAAADCRELTGHQAQAQELHLQTQPLSRRCGLSTPQLGDAQCRPPHTFPPVCGRPGRRPAVGEVASSAVGSSPASP